MTDYFKPERFMCHDCGHDTREMGELYMLFDWAWQYVVRAKRTGPVHMLCIGCVEQRIGFTLTQDWFSSAPQNFPWPGHGLGKPYHQSLRLRQRLRSHDRMMIPKDLSDASFNPRAIWDHRTRDHRMIELESTRD